MIRVTKSQILGTDDCLSVDVEVSPDGTICIQMDQRVQERNLGFGDFRSELDGLVAAI